MMTNNIIKTCYVRWQCSIVTTFQIRGQSVVCLQTHAYGTIIWQLIKLITCTCSSLTCSGLSSRSASSSSFLPSRMGGAFCSSRGTTSPPPASSPPPLPRIWASWMSGIKQSSDLKCTLYMLNFSYCLPQTHKLSCSNFLKVQMYRDMHYWCQNQGCKGNLGITSSSQPKCVQWTHDSIT